MADLYLTLLVLAGAVAFTFGFFVGSQVAETVLRGRENRVAAERRMIHEAWQRMVTGEPVHSGQNRITGGRNVMA